MRRRFRFAPWLLLLVVGCDRPAPVPALRAGDVVRPEVAVAPATPWAAGDVIAVSFLARIDRPDGTFYLTDAEVPLDRAEMTGRVTFLDGDRPVAEPHEVPFVHDC